MATANEIQNLLNKVEITIDEDDIKDAIGVLHNGESFEKGKNIEETLIKNAELINLKKLLVIIIKRRQELVYKYKTQKISNLIEKKNEDQLKKAIKFAKSYIKPEEFVKVETWDYTLGREEIIDSKTVIYGQEIEKKNKLYEKVKDILPDIGVDRFLELLKNVLEDEKMAEQQFKKEMNDYMEKEGMGQEEINTITQIEEKQLKNIFSQEEINTFLEKLNKAKSDEEIEEIFQALNKEKFNKRMKLLFERWGPYINAEKCILFYGCCISYDLEKRKKIR